MKYAYTFACFPFGFICDLFVLDSYSSYFILNDIIKTLEEDVEIQINTYILSIVSSLVSFPLFILLLVTFHPSIFKIYIF